MDHDSIVHRLDGTKLESAGSPIAFGASLSGISAMRRSFHQVPEQCLVGVDLAVEREYFSGAPPPRLAHAICCFGVL